MKKTYIIRGGRKGGVSEAMRRQRLNPSKTKRNDVDLIPMSGERFEDDMKPISELEEKDIESERLKREGDHGN